MKRTLLSLLLVILMLMPHGRSFAQNSQPSGFTDEETKALAAALVELDGRRKEVSALKEVVAAKDQHISALNDLITQQTAIIEQWKTAATERGTANGIDARIEASYRESVAKYEAEVTRVRQERDSAKRQRWTWSVVGMMLGATLAILANRN